MFDISLLVVFMFLFSSLFPFEGTDQPDADFSLHWQTPVSFFCDCNIAVTKEGCGSLPEEGYGDLHPRSTTPNTYYHVTVIEKVLLQVLYPM